MEEIFYGDSGYWYMKRSERELDFGEKISVIIPIYNAEKYLEKVVQSVVKQSYTNWELLLIENGSKDSSLEIAGKFSEKNEKIRLIQEKNKGIGFARNTGLKNATGEYIIFIDADDYLPDEAVFQRYINIVEKINSDIIVSNYARLWNGKLLPAASHSTFSMFERDSEEFRFRGFFSTGTLSYVWGKLYRKSFLEQNKITFSEYPYAEDKLFNMQCYVCGAKYAFVEQIGNVYRKNEDSVSYKYNPESSRCWLGIAQTFKNWMEENDKDIEKYEGLIQYTVFFASFFDAKMEYQKRWKTVWVIWRTLRRYGKDPVGKECFAKLAIDKKRIPYLKQRVWRIVIKGFSRGMKWQCYLALSFGIKQLIKRRIDERMSDTGLRE